MYNIINIDTHVLEEALGLRKCRKIFRAIYNAASGKIRLKDGSGVIVLSDPFLIEVAKTSCNGGMN